MALETNILLGLITAKNPERLHLTLNNKETYYRHVLYHSVINAYDIGVVIWMNIADTYGKSWTPWCYFEDPMYRIAFAYVPIWIAIAGIIVLDISVIRQTYKSYGSIARSPSRSTSPPNSSTDAGDV